MILFFKLWAVGYILYLISLVVCPSYILGPRYKEWQYAADEIYIDNHPAWATIGLIVAYLVVPLPWPYLVYRLILVKWRASKAAKA